MKPRGLWGIKDRRKYLDGLMVQLGYKCMEDWYKVSQEDIYKSGGGGVLNYYYNGSPSKALLSVYPTHNWDADKFQGKQRRGIFNGIMKKLGFKGMEHWYNVTVEDIYKNGGKRVLDYYYNGSLSDALLSIFPEHNWELDKFETKPRG